LTLAVAAVGFEILARLPTGLARNLVGGRFEAFASPSTRVSAINLMALPPDLCIMLKILKLLKESYRPC